MAPLLYVAFFLSGAAGLIYETTWSRYLGLLLGHSAYAQAIVLVVFLGGMAAGAVAAGRYSERIGRPWLAYAIAEAIIGLLGIAFHAIYTAVSDLAYGSLFPALESGPALQIAKWMIAIALILPQSVLLGTTFPLMSAEVLRRIPGSPGRVLSMLYFSNGLGGAVGVLVAGFWLLGRGGLPGSVAAAGTVNLFVAVLVAACAIAAGAASPDSHGATAAPAPVRGSVPRALRTMLIAVAFGTAVASFIYEIAWIRMLSLVLGSATHSFELMLSAFILGIAAGAFWVRRRIDQFEDPLAALGIVQWVMGALAVATLPLYLASFRWTATLLAALDLTPEGYGLFSVARYAICLAIMLPATFCAGITLPLITRILFVSGEGESAVGAVYGANTLGSIVGVSLAALVLMPLIGLKALLITGALLDMALGIWLLVAARWRFPSRRTIALASGAAAVLLVGGVGWLARFDRQLLTSGVFRLRQLFIHGREIVYYRDGRTATVSAATEYGGTILLATNGKIDASLAAEWATPLEPGAARRVLTRDVGTQLLLPLFALAHAPRARQVAVVGHGSGMSSHTLLGSPYIERLTTVEIEPAMIAGSRVFHPANARVFDDPRARFAIDDARAYFAGGSTRYDLILSEPSNPWVNGVSGLFTTEFYAQVARQLADGGVLGQWIHLYEINDDLVLRIIAALHEHFDSYEIYQTAPNDMIVVAAQGGLSPPDWSVVRYPGIAADLAHVVPLTGEMFGTLHVAGRGTFAPLLDRALVISNSDYHPALDLGAERHRFLGSTAYGFTTLHTHRFEPFTALAGRPRLLATEMVTPTPEIGPTRAGVVSARLRTDPQRDTMPSDAELSAARYRRGMLDDFIAVGAPPPDWAMWLRTVLLVDGDLHGTAAGHADERFYESLKDFVARARAPGGAAAATDFLHALARWDWPAASRAGDVLIDASLSDSWIPSEMLRDGAVVAKLKTGDVAGARRVFDRFTPESAEGRDLRDRLLDAHIQRAEEASAREPG
jgi:predicted membrane-bound spermidine synthase